MAIAPISSAGSLTSAASNLRLDDLLQVLLTELTHQNPFKPVDNKDFMGQIAQFASLDSSQRLNQSIDQLLALQAMNQSVGLIGKRVSARVDGQTITGTVISPEERIGVLDGLRAATANAAFVGLEEDRLGTLEAGKLADVAVLARDPLAVAPEELKDIPVDLTLVQGRVVYQR